MSCLRFLYLFAYGGVYNIQRCAVVLFVPALCLVYPMLPVSLDCTFLIPLRYSLTFIYTEIQTEVDSHKSHHQMRYHNNNKWPGQTKDYNCCFSAKQRHEGVRA